jgi:hypothetical protein
VARQRVHCEILDHDLVRARASQCRDLLVDRLGPDRAGPTGRLRVAGRDCRDRGRLCIGDEQDTLRAEGELADRLEFRFAFLHARREAGASPKISHPEV